ncbi:MAG: glucose-1-phosphate thymidylyltransferase RfbA [Actinomycetales bacterium]
MRGIILAGGTGSRLHPVTQGVSKQLVPVYDKPMIYYPLCTLIEAGVREVLVITTPHDADQFRRLLGDGSQFGISIGYTVQPTPAGLAQAFTLAADFLDGEQAALILGDNIFHGSGLREEMIRHADTSGGTIFGYWVKDPRAYGVVELDEQSRPVAIEEKPAVPRSHLAIPGLYFFDADVVGVAEGLTPSARGELEIVDVMRHYLRAGTLEVVQLPRGTAWLDTGTFDSLNDASNFVRTLQARQGLQIGCPEEAAWRAGVLTDDALRTVAEPLTKSGYGNYLLGLLDE